MHPSNSGRSSPYYDFSGRSQPRQETSFSEYKNTYSSARQGNPSHSGDQYTLDERIAHTNAKLERIRNGTNSRESQLADMDSKKTDRRFDDIQVRADRILNVVSGIQTPSREF